MKLPELLNSILSYPAVQTGISLAAIVISDEIIASETFQNLLARAKSSVGIRTESENEDPAPAYQNSINHRPIPNQLRLTWEPNGSHSLGAIPKNSLENLNPTNVHARVTLLSLFGTAIKTVVAMYIPPTLFIRISKRIPSFGGWLEYAIPLPGLNDDLHYAVLNRTARDVQDLVDVIPKDSLNRVLAKRDEFNKTPLYWATHARVQHTEKFKILLEALKPEHRLAHLTNIVCPNERAAPLIFCLDFHNATECWDIAMTLLTPLEQKQLAYAKNLRGDSLLLEASITYGGKVAPAKILAPFDLEERKAYLCELCPHGSNATVEIFAYTPLNYVKEVFPSLPDDEWRKVFNYRPTNWTMTIGEKIALITIARKYSHEIRNYLKEKYGIRVPQKYKNIKGNELRQTLDAINESFYAGNCDSRHNFKLQHGEAPEILLEMEPHLEPSAYTPAFRKLQKEHHPDKVKQSSHSNMSAHVNAAREFVNNKATRSTYRTPALARSVEIIIGQESSTSDRIGITIKYSNRKQ